MTIYSVLSGNCFTDKGKIGRIEALVGTKNDIIESDMVEINALPYGREGQTSGLTGIQAACPELSTPFRNGKAIHPHRSLRGMPPLRSFNALPQRKGHSSPSIRNIRLIPAIVKAFREPFCGHFFNTSFVDDFIKILLFQYPRIRQGFMASKGSQKLL